MKRILSVFVLMLVMFCSTCFAISGTSGQTTTHNAFRVKVSAPSMPQLVYAKMPAFTFRLWPLNGRPSDKINGTLSFYDGNTGEFLESRNVYHKLNFILPKERRSYIISIWSDRPVKWEVRKNTQAIGNRYFYDIERANYKGGSVG
jgi:hypothetical protein